MTANQNITEAARAAIDAYSEFSDKLDADTPMDELDLGVRAAYMALDEMIIKLELALCALTGEALTLSDD